MIRPGSVVVLVAFAAIGMAQAGETRALHPLLTSITVILAAWYLNATCLNDLADEQIDRVNLPGSSRPLVSGLISRSQLFVIGVAAGALSLATAWTIDHRVVLVVIAGLILNVVYSMRPFRLSDRGGVAAAVLPAGYVAIPYLIGAFSVQTHVTGRGFVLLTALYVSTVGRVLLKDFRDVEGDAKFGKTGFLLKRGARTTCATSALAWSSGTAILLTLQPVRSALIPAFLIYLACILYSLKRIANSVDKDEQIAIVGCVSRVAQAMILVLLANLSMVDRGWQQWQIGAITILLVVAGVWSFAGSLPDSPSLSSGTALATDS